MWLRLESLQRTAAGITRNRTLWRFSLPDTADHLALESTADAASCATEKAEGQRLNSR